MPADYAPMMAQKRAAPRVVIARTAAPHDDTRRTAELSHDARSGEIRSSNDGFPARNRCLAFRSKCSRYPPEYENAPCLPRSAVFVLSFATRPAVTLTILVPLFLANRTNRAFAILRPLTANRASPLVIVWAGGFPLVVSLKSVHLREFLSSSSSDISRCSAHSRSASS